MRKYGLRIIFPAERPPKRAILARREPYVTQELGEKAFRELEDGRQELRVALKNVRRDKIMLRWWW